jgi:hypothetical protein
MRNILFIILFSLITINANAEYIFDFSWNFGSLGLGMNYSSYDNDSIEATASIFNLIIEHKDTNIGLEFNPIKFWTVHYFQDEVEIKYERISFINSNLYWDLILNKSILFGPFVSINYLFVNNQDGINANEYIFAGGLRFSYMANDYMFSLNNNYYQIFNAEIGYRNIFDKHKFYFSVNFDLLLMLYCLFPIVIYPTSGRNRQ